MFLSILHKTHNNSVLIKFVSGSIFNSISQIVSNIIILKIIQPNELGTWNSLIIIQTYALFFQAGVLNGLNRELPFHLGKNDLKKANEYASSSLSFFLLGIVAFLLVSAFLGIFVFYGKPIEWLYTYSAIVLITSSRFYENYLTSTFRSNNSFEKLSHVYFFRGIFQFVSILLIFALSYHGYVIRMLSTSIFTMVMLHFIRPIKVLPKFNLKLLLQLMKVGLPIFALIYLYNSSLTFDRLLFIKYSKSEVLGYYSLGIMALTAFKMLPESLANYLYPKLSYKLGEGKNTFDLINLSLKTNVLVFCLMIAIAGIAYFFMPIIINTFFPTYIQGTKAAQILIISAAFIGGTLGNNVITSLKAWSELALIYLTSALLNVIFIYSFSRLFSDLIQGISLGVLASSVAFMLISNIVLFTLRKKYKRIVN